MITSEPVFITRGGHHPPPTPPQKHGFCIFCYKVCPSSRVGEGYHHHHDYAYHEDEGAGREMDCEEMESSVGGSGSIIPGFFRLLERFSGEKMRAGKEPDFLIGTDKLLGCCDECGVIVKSFSSVYHQLKCMEMQLEWKLESLVSIMKLANRVPSRLEQLNRLFGDNDNNNYSHSGDCHEELGNVGKHVADNEMGDMSLKSFKTFRQGIIKTCDTRLSKSQPRVVVERSTVDMQVKDRTEFQFQPHTIQFNLVVKEESCETEEQDLMDDSFVDESIVESDEGSVTSDRCQQYSEHLPQAENANLRKSLRQAEIQVPTEKGTQVVTPLPVHCQDIQLRQGSKSFPQKIHRILTKSRHSSCTIKRGKVRKDKPFRCGPCNTWFKSYRYLRLHKVGNSHHSLMKILLKRNQRISNAPTGEEVGAPRVNYFRHESLRAQKAKRHRQIKKYSDDCLVPPEAAVAEESTSSPTPQQQRYNFREKRKRSYLQMNEKELDEENENDSDYNSNFTLSDAESGTSIRSTKFAEVHVGGFSRSKHYLVKCDVCQLTVMKPKLERHIKQNHDVIGMTPEKILRCNMEGCKAYFRTSTQINYHQRRLHGFIPITSQPDWMEESLTEEDIMLAKKNGGFRCNMCSKGFQSFVRLKIHKRRYHRKDTSAENAQPIKIGRNRTNDMGALFVCPVVHCAQTFNLLKNLKSHQKLHGSFQCHACDVIEEFAPDLALHETQQHAVKDEGVSNFSCSRCPSSYYAKNMYIKHFVERHLQLSSTTRICPVCQQEFVDAKTSLGRHFVKYHKTDGLDPSQIHKCDLCPAYFTKSAYLFTHKYKKHYNGKCPDCGKEFSSSSFLKRHMSRPHRQQPPSPPKIEEPKEKEQVCDVCSVSIPVTGIMEHVQSHVGEYAQRCPNFPTCPYVFSSRKSVMRHHKKAAPCRKVYVEKFPLLVCDTCGFTTARTRELGSHIQRNHERAAEKSFKCPLENCETSFCVRQSIWYHLDTHFRKQVSLQQCEHCSKRFKVESMKEHLRSEHQVQEILKCEHCPSIFSARPSLIEHLSVHRLQGISCDICGDGVKYTVHAHLRAHYRAVHQVETKQYICTRCNQIFVCKNNLTTHLREKHSAATATTFGGNLKKKRKRFACDICFGTVEFTHETTLIRHKIKVHGADPFTFTCTTCGATFSDSTALYRHGRAHAETKAEEYKCEVEGCGKVFTRRQNWYRHKSVGHGGDKPYVCELCGKPYASTSGLQHHKQSVHTRLRPAVCDICGEGFVSWAILKRHKLIHTGERPFSCQVCNQSFRHKSTLDTHFKSHEIKGSEFKPTGPMKHIRKRKAQ